MNKFWFTSLATIRGPIAAGSRSEPRGSDELLGSRVDHLVYAAPDLNLDG